MISQSQPPDKFTDSGVALFDLHFPRDVNIAMISHQWPYAIALYENESTYEKRAFRFDSSINSYYKSHAADGIIIGHCREHGEGLPIAN